MNTGGLDEAMPNAFTMKDNVVLKPIQLVNASPTVFLFYFFLF